MYTLLRNEEFGTYCLKHFIADSNTDLSQIIVDYKDEPESRKIHAGWTCKVTNDTASSIYILTVNNTWVVDANVDTSKQYIWDGGTPDSSSTTQTTSYDGGGVSGSSETN
jgi:hypothetical protein